MPASPLFDLTGTAALVTGGNGGIGRGIALGLAAAGASVMVAARNTEKNSAVLAELRALGVRAEAVACDILEGASIEAAVQATVDAFGRLDILVNNAGVAGGGRPEEITDEVWDRVVDTNLRAVFQCCRAAHPHLKAGGRGKVINIGSMYSIFGSARVLPYSASKGGVIQLTKSLAVAWARDGIQVNAILPGWITTEMTAGVATSGTMHDSIVARTPAGRFGEPEELAGAAVFLAAHASDFVTGVVLPVDGGYAVG